MPPFKFSLPEFDDSSIFTVDPIFGAQPKSGGASKVSSGVSYEKPKHLANLKSEPQYLISCDLKELERNATGGKAPEPPKQPEIYRPQTSSGPSAGSILEPSQASVGR